jgi:hypothetical protein
VNVDVNVHVNVNVSWPFTGGTPDLRRPATRGRRRRARAGVCPRRAGTNAIYVDPVNDLVVVVRWIESESLAAFVERMLAAIE